MKDQLSLAHINIFAILRNLKNLCKLDEKCKQPIEGKKLSIELSVANGPKALMEFNDGKVTVKNGGKSRTLNHVKGNSSITKSYYGNRFFRNCE